jgi:hypothetical protein
LEQQKDGFHNLQIWFCLNNRKTVGLMNWARPGGTIAQVGFKPTVPAFDSNQQQGSDHRTAFLPVPSPLTHRRRRVTWFRTLSLSIPYKKETPAEASTFAISFPRR